MNRDNIKLRILGGTVSQVMAAAELLLGYLKNDNVPENTVQRIELIRKELNEIVQHLMKEARRDLDQDTIELIFKKSFNDWSKCLDDLLIIVNEVTQTLPLNHVQEIKRIVEELGPFIEARNKLIDEHIMRYTVKASQYLPSQGFLVIIYSDFDFLNQIPCPVVLHLEDNEEEYIGQLVGGRFWPVENEVDGWGLIVTSDEIQNPEAVTISAIEIYPKV